MRYGSSVLASVARQPARPLQDRVRSDLSGAPLRTVRDASGAVLPGDGEASSPGADRKGRSAVTDEQGQYKIVNLPVGPTPSPSP